MFCSLVVWSGNVVVVRSESKCKILSAAADIQPCQLFVLIAMNSLSTAPPPGIKVQMRTAGGAVAVYRSDL